MLRVPCSMKEPRLQIKYIKEVIPAMKAKFGYKNDLAVPTIKKVLLNTGIGRTARDEKMHQHISKDLSSITGQIPSLRPARKAISGFKIRAGLPVGLRVTLHGRRMWEFIDRLISLSLPRVRDFRGISSKSFDGKGNVSIGLKEHIVFPEIEAENVKDIFGLEVNVVTSAKTDEEGKELLKLLGFPIREKNSHA